MVGIAACRPRTVSGHVAALRKSVMNSRRIMLSPYTAKLPTSLSAGAVGASQQNFAGDDRFGSMLLKKSRNAFW